MGASWRERLARALGGAALVLGLLGSAQAQSNAYMSAADEPWLDGSNLMAMDAAFGSDWSRLTYGDSFAGYAMLYIDGGGWDSYQMVDYLNANRASLEDYVLNGGRLFINAGTEGQTSFDLVFGATSTEDDPAAATVFASAADPSSELFSGAGDSWLGGYFAQDNIAAPDTFNSLIVGDNGETVLAGGFFGAGYVMLGSQTNSAFHASVNGSDPFQLRVNELLYTATAVAPPPPVVTPVPEPQTWAMFLLGAVALVGARARRRRH